MTMIAQLPWQHRWERYIYIYDVNITSGLVFTDYYTFCFLLICDPTWADEADVTHTCTQGKR